MNLFSTFGPGELLPAAAGGFAQVGDIAFEIGQSIRSQVLQNRAENLITFGGPPPVSKAANVSRNVKSQGTHAESNPSAKLGGKPGFSEKLLREVVQEIGPPRAGRIRIELAVKM